MPRDFETFDRRDEFRARVLPLLKQLRAICRELDVSYLAAFSMAFDGQRFQIHAEFLSKYDRTPDQFLVAAETVKPGILKEGAEAKADAAAGKGGRDA